jgi:hypothetical protein
VPITTHGMSTIAQELHGHQSEKQEIAPDLCTFEISRGRRPAGPQTAH